MDGQELNAYQQQLAQVNQALSVCLEGPEKTELLTLKANIEELLELTNNDDSSEYQASESGDKLQDEFAAFMAEMEKEGAVEKKNNDNSAPKSSNLVLKDVEGKKCRAPHQHQWGNIVYHNAMICSVISEESEEPKVKVLFTNPTHQEMLPCPFYFDTDCKFSEEQCRFSHGEVVLYSSLQEYVPPNFELLTKGSSVLAKKSNNLWYRAKVKNIYEEKCLVRFECDSKELEVDLEHVLPLENDENGSSEEDSDSLGDDEELVSREDIINHSLMLTPDSQALGDWERFTKGMGSKLMIKMGYIIGSGLGKKAEGRVNPVSAVIFPAGKSLDHCMRLREQAGGDKDLFSVEKKLKRLQRKEEVRNKKAYEREKNKQDVFSFINNTVQHKIEEKTNTRQEREHLKQETARNLNIRSLQVDKDIKEAERDLEQLQNSLSRHKDVASDVYKKLKNRFSQRQGELIDFKKQAQNIKNEQNLRDNKKKLTIF